MIYDLIVIGGGASGLTCAYRAFKRGKKVLILEREKKVGAKLLVTGNGKCNLSATDVSPEKYNNPDFVRDILTKEDVNGFFREIGILTRTVGKRLYPYSESALTVVNKLRAALPEDCIRTADVKEIGYADRLYIAEGYRAKNIALCTGSAATKGKASYDLVKKFGHKSTELRPSLVPLVTDMTYIKGLSGLRSKVSLGLLCGEQTVAKEEGEILFRDNGISGICAMCLSAYVARHPGKYCLTIDFIPDAGKEIKPLLNKSGIDGILHQSIAQAVIKYAQNEKVPFERALSDFRVEIISGGPLSQAQVVCGGLQTKDFDNTLQSKLSPGLYAAGEVLDIDGECGGYNLHWAFASALRIGRSVT